MTMYTNDTEMIIYSQSFVDVLADVQCTNNSVVLAFNNNASYTNAASQWSWVDGKPEHDVVLLADWPPCRVDGQPQPYRINNTVAAPSNFSIALVGQAQDWKTAVPTFDLDMGTAFLNQSAGVSPPASRRSVSPPTGRHPRGAPRSASQAKGIDRTTSSHYSAERRSHILKRSFGSFFRSISHAISKAVNVVVDTAKNVVKDVVNTAKNVVSDLGNGDVLGAGKDIASGALNVTEDVVEGAANVVKQGVENVIDVGKALVTDVAHTGADIVHEVASVGKLIIHAVEDPVGTLTSILSPSISHTWDVNLEHDVSGNIIDANGTFLNNDYMLKMDCTHCGSTGKISFTGKIKISFGSPSTVSVSVKPQDVTAFLNLRTQFTGQAGLAIGYAPTLVEEPIGDLGFVIPKIFEAGLVWRLIVGGNVNSFNGTFEFDWGVNATLSNEAIASFDLLHPEQNEVHGWTLDVQKHLDAHGNFSFATTVSVTNALALTFKVFGQGVSASINLAAPSLKLQVTQLFDDIGDVCAASNISSGVHTLYAPTATPAANMSLPLLGSAIPSTTASSNWSVVSNRLDSYNATVLNSSMSVNNTVSVSNSSMRCYVTTSLSNGSTQSYFASSISNNSIPSATSVANISLPSYIATSVSNGSISSYLSTSAYSSSVTKNVTPNATSTASRNATTMLTRNMTIWSFPTNPSYPASSSSAAYHGYGAYPAYPPSPGYPASYQAVPSYRAHSRALEKRRSYGVELRLSICAGLGLSVSSGPGSSSVSDSLPPIINNQRRSTDERSAMQMSMDLLNEEVGKFNSIHRTWDMDSMHDEHELAKRTGATFGVPIWVSAAAGLTCIVLYR